MISIVIPLFNKESQIRNTLQTVLNQTYQNFEIIIVNDGSTDNSIAEVSKVSDSRIRIIHQENTGVSVARNHGIQESKGEFIAFLDADDEWRLDYLATQIELTEKYPEASVFATNYEFRNAQDKMTSTIIRGIPFSDESGLLTNYFKVATLSHPPIWTSAVLVKRNAIQTVGGFPVGIRSGEDLLTWARLAARYKIAYCRKALAVFNVEGYDRNEKPKREPAEDDIVGRELRKLKAEFAPPMIDHYIALWHKMRSVIYLRLGQSSKGFNEATKAIACNPLNKKMWMLAALNLLPSKIQRGILSRI